MLDFCTYFDSNYLAKGLTLYRSLVRHATPFRLWVLCFDDLAYETLQGLSLSGIIPISLQDFEAGDRELARAKGNRSRIEYYFTCTPSLPLYILDHYADVDLITYLDADLYFFSAPSPIYRELGDRSVLIIGHRFPEHQKHLEENGIYNVGYLSFRRDDEGLACLHWWRDRCLEWCYDRVEEGRFADQGYLNDWPQRFRQVVVLEHKGAGLAPWNVQNYSLRLNGGHVWVDGQPLVFFHFHRLKQTRTWLYEPSLEMYGAHADLVLRQNVYGPYIRELRQTARQTAQQTSVQSRLVRLGTNSIRFRKPGTASDRKVLGRTLDEIRKVYHELQGALRGQLLVTIGGRVV
jgi:hypothetical protein